MWREDTCEIKQTADQFLKAHMHSFSAFAHFQETKEISQMGTDKLNVLDKHRLSAGLILQHSHRALDISHAEQPSLNGCNTWLLIYPPNASILRVLSCTLQAEALGNSKTNCLHASSYNDSLLIY